MRTEGVRCSSALDVKALGQTFRSVTQSMYGMGQKVGSFARTFSGYGATKMEYFTPTKDSPFDALDDDPVAFSVGVSIPKFSGTGGGVVTLHLYVWDRGSSREVLLVSPHTSTTGHSAKKALSKVLGSFQQLDPSLSVLGD